MKLHLPVQLFRAVLGLMLGTPSLLYAAYTAPSYIYQPYNNTDRVYYSYEIDDVWESSYDYNVLLETDVTASSSYAPVMSSYAGSRYFTSASASYLRDLYLSGSSSRWFYVDDYTTLTFAALDELTFYGNGSTSNSGGVICADYGSDIALSQNYWVSFESNKGYYGGAIYSDSSYSSLTVQNNADVEFLSNYASYDGGVIYSSGGSIDISGNDSVQFSDNSASDDGGVIYSSGGGVDISGNDSVQFSGNSAGCWGGVICGVSWASVNILNNEEVEFTGNRASGSGGAIYASSGDINIAGNSSVLFEKNTVGNYGSYRLQSIYSDCNLNLSAPNYGEIRFHDTISVGGDLSLNSSYTDADGYSRAAGGDIIFDGQYAESHLAELNDNTPSTSSVSTSQTSTVYGYTYLYGGTLKLKGGACLEGYGFSASGGKVSMENATLNQNSNSVSFAYGTTLSVGAGSKMTASTLSLADGSTLEFALSSGYSDACFTLSGDLSIGNSLTLTFLNASSLDVSNNKLMYVSGSIDNWDESAITITGIADNTYALTWVDSYLVLNAKGGVYESTSQLTGGVDLNEYTSVTFRDNSNSSNGAAISSSSSYENIALRDNDALVFRNNNVSSYEYYSTNAYGGAIYKYGGSVNIHGNGSVSFVGNTVSSNTGFSSYYYSYAARANGGAIYGTSSIYLESNTVVSFTNNSAQADGADESYACGGAIWGNQEISLLNNGTVTFSGNKATALNGPDGCYAQGGAIYSSGTLSICNNADVLFEKNAVGSPGSYRLQSIYSENSLELSAPNSGKIRFHDTIYVGGDLNLNSYDSDAVGDIIFDGQYAESHLRELNGRTPSTSSVTTSQTSTVNGYTYLYGGTLKLKGGACLEGYGFSASGGKVSIENATLNQNSNSASFAYGTTLSVGAGSKMTASTLSLETGSTLEFALSSGYSDACFTLSGDLSIGNSLTLSFLNASSLDVSNYKLMYVSGSRTGWDTDAITLTGITASVDDLEWVDGYLILNYKGGNLVYTSQLTGNVDLRRYASITFQDNSNSSSGAAIYSSSPYYQVYNISLTKNDYIAFNNNSVSKTGNYSASAYGGAIYKNRGSLNIDNNGSVSFSGNSVFSSAEYYSDYDAYVTEACGGAIYGASDIVIKSNTGGVSFTNNTAQADGADEAYARGGAIWGNQQISLLNNGSVTFSGNEVSVQNGPDGQSACGGAIYGESDIKIESNTGGVSFTNNTAQADGADEAYARGGAIWGNQQISLLNNGSVTFSGNKVSVQNGSDGQSALGGAIYSASSLDISNNNGSVSFSGNSVVGSGTVGGAIYSTGNLSIRNNASVIFEKNVERTDAGYLLRGVYVANDAGTVSLTAAAGNSIEFRDSVYIGSGNTVELNNTYTDASGTSYSQEGDIIFTGAYAKNDLYIAKGYEYGSSEEVRNSQTSYINAMTNLYGGRLRVEDGAVYMGQGITAVEGSAAIVSVKDAELRHLANEMTFNSGTMLELKGSCTLSGHVNMLSGSRIGFGDVDCLDVTFLHGDITFNKSLTVTLSGVDNQENNILMYVTGEVEGWSDLDVSLPSSGYKVEDLTWVKNCLVLNYNKATFSPYVNGDVKFSERFTEAISYHFYNHIWFDYTQTIDDFGGAIYSPDVPVSLGLNGKVEFSSNTVKSKTSALGGAIYGDLISIRHNDEVVFRGNTVTSTTLSYYGYNHGDGGAIYGSGKVSDNGSVVFTQNAAQSEDDSRGGAIYVQNNISLSGNESIEFSRNTVASASSSYGGAIYAGYEDTISITDNKRVMFSMNSTASSATVDTEETLGGAIYIGGGHLEIRNNDTVVFVKNAEKMDNRHYLRSLYVDGGSASLSAAEGKSIMFRDAVYVGGIEEFVLNQDYNGIDQTGDIIFSGATTVADLKEMKNGLDASSDEILTSRTSEVYAMTNLYGGRLIVEDGAVYECAGITAAVDSGATVMLRNGSLARTDNLLASQFAFHRGTGLSFVGVNRISAELLTMMDDSSWTFNLAAENVTQPMLTYSGLLAQRGKLNIQINATEILTLGDYKLLQVTESVGNWWSAEDIVVNGGELTLNDLQWVDNTLYFHYVGQDIPGSSVSPDTPETPDSPGSPNTPINPDFLKPYKPSGSILAASAVDKNTEVQLTGKGTITLQGKVTPGAITVNTAQNLTLKSDKKVPGSIAGTGDLVKDGQGTLTMNDGNSGWSGNTYLNAGTLKVKGTSSLGKGDVYVKGGVLNLGSKAVSNDIVQSGNAAIKSGKKFAGTYTLEKGELQRGSVLNINSGKTATLLGGTVNGTISGNGKVNVTGSVTLGSAGKLATSALTLGANAALTTGTKGLSSKKTDISVGENATLNLIGKVSGGALSSTGGTIKATAALALNGNLSASDSEVVCSGKVSAANLSLTRTEFKLVTKTPQSLSLKGNATLTDSILTVDGKMNANNLTLNNSALSLSAYKPQNLTVKQNLTVNTGSRLSLNGKLSAGSLTLKSGSTLELSGSKPQTVKVKGTLTINSGSCIVLDYEFDKGKTYKLMTFGSYSGSQDFYTLFGVSMSDCLLVNTGKALTLTVTGNWNPQFAAATALAMDDAMVETDTAGEVAREENGNVVTGTPVLTVPDNRPLADALVQANWGQLEASRAFVNAMANRSMAVQLGNGERSVWASAIGSSSRHDTAGGHNGADTNVSGGAFGLETQVGRASLFGMALGNSWTRVSAHGFGTIEQDTTHLGLYGQTNWRSGIAADWSAAYGRSESESMGSDWNQKHLQLDGRVSYNHELNASTVLSPFAGVQYYASDAAGIGSTDTGSLQNLRAEIGVGASHRVGKLGVFGEIAVHHDAARNNPSVSMEGSRYTGMNPGRTGLNFTVGASYELNENWSMNASYTGEFVENANAHSANVGASYKF